MFMSCERFSSPCSPLLLHVIPNFAAIILLEEAVDLVVELLQLERSEVLLVEIPSILVNFFCRKRLEIRVG